MRLCNKNHSANGGDKQMSKWKIPNKNPYQDPGKFPLNIMLVISCAIFLLCMMYYILNWFQEKKVADDLTCNPFSNSVSNLVCGDNHSRYNIFSVLLCGLP